MRHQDGFSMVELLVALTLLSVIFVSLSAAVGRYAHGVATTGARSAALQLANDRLEAVRMHPIYGELHLFTDTEFDVSGVEGSVRETKVSRIADTVSAGVVDYTVVTVDVTRPGVLEPVSRTTIVAAP